MAPIKKPARIRAASPPWARFLAALALAGCAAPARWPAGRDLLAGVTPVLRLPPASLGASLEITALAGRERRSVTAALAAEPGRAYKLELSGFPGVTAGAFLWRPERWDLVLYERGEYVEGRGGRIDVGLLETGDATVHDLFSWLWGDFFPGDTALSGLPADLARAPSGGFAYGGTSGAWRIGLDGESGLPRYAQRADSAIRLEYAAWRTGSGKGDRPLPARVRILRRGRAVLEIRVSALKDNPAWKRDPFVLRIPPGFTRVERLPD